MGWKLLIAFVLIVLVGAGGLATYGARVSPPQQTFQQVLPNDRFPN